MNRAILFTNGQMRELTQEEAGDWKLMKEITKSELFDLVRLPGGWIMLVDDEGLITGREVNLAATILYRSVCRPGMQDGIIVGDVAIVKDGDFE